MQQTQITTNPPLISNKPFGLSLKIAGKTIKRTVSPTVGLAVSVHCEMCAETARESLVELRRTGWGIYSESAFCPHHEAMI